jgi:hypothetical protein
MPPKPNLGQRTRPDRMLEPLLSAFLEILFPIVFFYFTDFEKGRFKQFKQFKRYSEEREK